MLTLYEKTFCPYCKRVLDVAEQLGITFKKKNIANVVFSEELIVRGGKRQVPYLVDEERGIEMYESEDIVKYLETYYGNGSAERITKNGSVCPIV